jgi:DNA polymerase-3 subunit delta'
LCERSGGKFEACDKCPSCAQVDAGTHPDAIFAARPEDKVEFPIGVIRDELMPKLYLKAARGGYKIAIVDDVDSFNDEAANCFLKTLEEPPPRSVLILLATNPERQLATIVSRCQVVRFAPLRRDLIVRILGEQGVEPEKAQRVARLSGGSLGQAGELTDDVLWQFRRELAADLARPQLDAVALGKKWMDFVTEAGKEGAKQRRRAMLVVKLAIDLLHVALRASTGADGHVEAEDHAAVSTLVNRMGTDRLLKLIDRCMDADKQLNRMVQLVLIVEALADAFG